MGSFLYRHHPTKEWTSPFLVDKILNFFYQTEAYFAFIGLNLINEDLLFFTVQKVNSYACEKLAMVEEHYPVITRPADELWQEGKEKCSFVIQPVTGSIGVVRNGYNGIVNKGQETVLSKVL